MTLVGPSVAVDPARVPARADLAHIRLAGQVFVSYYAMPVSARVADSGALLRQAARGDAEVVVTLAAGTAFAALDVSGAWAWGQAGGDDGLVGYVARSDLQGIGA